jgi:hypothetical protein
VGADAVGRDPEGGAVVRLDRGEAALEEPSLPSIRFETPRKLATNSVRGRS